jgi:hypothetical protein
MTFEVLRDFEAETLSGTLTLKEGQKIRLSKDEAISLIEDGSIRPIERVAYKVYSEILQTYLRIVETDQDMYSLRSQGVSEAIYTADEISKLKGIDKDSLKAIHKAKEVFQQSKVEEINKSDKGKSSIHLLTEDNLMPFLSGIKLSEVGTMKLKRATPTARHTQSQVRKEN